MKNQVRFIPRPLVRTNQCVIVLSVIITWLTGQEWILTIPLVAGISGLVLGVNPIIKFASFFLRKPRSEYIKEEWNQQQFNQIIAVVCLATGYISFLLGWTIVAYVSTIMVASAALIAIMGFCIGCFIRYQWKKLTFTKSIN